MALCLVAGPGGSLEVAGIASGDPAQLCDVYGLDSGEVGYLAYLETAQAFYEPITTDQFLASASAVASVIVGVFVIAYFVGSVVSQVKG